MFDRLMVFGSGNLFPVFGDRFPDSGSENRYPVSANRFPVSAHRFPVPETGFRFLKIGFRFRKPVSESVSGSGPAQSVRAQEPHGCLGHRLFLIRLSMGQVGLDLCVALKELHDLGLVHRDIKPANIIRASPTAIVDPAGTGCDLTASTRRSTISARHPAASGRAELSPDGPTLRTAVPGLSPEVSPEGGSRVSQQVQVRASVAAEPGPQADASITFGPEHGECGSSR